MLEDHPSLSAVKLRNHLSARGRRGKSLPASDRSTSLLREPRCDQLQKRASFLFTLSDCYFCAPTEVLSLALLPGHRAQTLLPGDGAVGFQGHQTSYSGHRARFLVSCSVKRGEGISFSKHFLSPGDLHCSLSVYTGRPIYSSSSSSSSRPIYTGLACMHL